MKTQFLFLLFFLALRFTYAQEFSFSMHFEDAAGNKDTLVLGYDLYGTDSIDNAFGEINIKSQPLNNNFDVRITDELESRSHNPAYASTYHTKKQIIRHPCYPIGYGYPVVYVDIKCTHWPVKASWDSTIFNDSCRIESLITSINPGGWWDVSSISNLSRVLLKDQPQVTFTPNFINNEVFEESSYINGNQDTISVFWIALGGNLIAKINEMGIKNNEYYFNILNNNLIINLNDNQTFVEEIEIISISGKAIQSNKKSNNINISQLKKGLYMCRFITNDKKMESFKFLKD